MTKVHGFVMCFALLVVALCGMSSACQPNVSKLGDLALVAIGAVSGNAMNEIRHARKQKQVKRKRSNGK
jgi:hypothetical protein